MPRDHARRDYQVAAQGETPRAITADEAAVLVRDGSPDEIMVAYLSMNLETPDEIRQQMRQAMRSAK
jgi:hypothetical protein